jgi:hypothetical protein
MREHPKARIVITWIPGHSEIEGNEHADAEAKKAALNPANRLYKHKPLKSAKARYVNDAAKAQWRKEWNESSSASEFSRMTKRKGFKTGTKIYNTIPSRQTTAALVRLRTGHCRLKRHLHRISVEDSPHCECNQGVETVEHFLLECRRYTRQRGRLREEARTGEMRADRLLGDPRNIAHTMEYVVTTKGKEI